MKAKKSPSVMLIFVMHNSPFITVLNIVDKDHFYKELLFHIIILSDLIEKHMRGESPQK